MGHEALRGGASLVTNDPVWQQRIADYGEIGLNLFLGRVMYRNVTRSGHLNIGNAQYGKYDIYKEAEKHITDSGEAVLGHYNKPPGDYIVKAQIRGASYFDLGKMYNQLSPAQQKAANLHFLDVIAEKGQNVYLSVDKKFIKPNSSLKTEIDYLITQKGYKWVNQWMLKKN